MAVRAGWDSGVPEAAPRLADGRNGAVLPAPYFVQPSSPALPRNSLIFPSQNFLCRLTDMKKWHLCLWRWTSAEPALRCRRSTILISPRSWVASPSPLSASGPRMPMTRQHKKSQWNPPAVRVVDRGSPWLAAVRAASLRVALRSVLTSHCRLFISSKTRLKSKKLCLRERWFVTQNDPWSPRGCQLRPLHSRYPCHRRIRTRGLYTSVNGGSTVTSAHLSLGTLFFFM